MDSVLYYVDEYVLPGRQMQELVLQCYSPFGELGHMLSNWFWNPGFWLPEGIAWDDLTKRSEVTLADPTEIWTYPIIIAAILYLLKSVWLVPEYGSRLAKWLGVKNKTVIVPKPNVDLEKLFLSHGTRLPPQVIRKAMTDLHLSKWQIQSWLRKRKYLERFTKTDKFIDVFGSFLYHIFITVYIAYSLYNKPWLYDVSLCFKGHPYHSVEPEIWWLYMISLGNYWCLTYKLVLHPYGKDIPAQIVHHMCTVLLISFSWTSGFFRFGSLILLVHEPTDIPLLLAKMFRYAKLSRYTDIIFAIFVIVWFVTRVYLFMFWLLPSSILHMPPEIISRAVYVQYINLIVLLALNLVWTSTICNIIFKKLFIGSPLDDVRSSDESSDKEN